RGGSPLINAAVDRSRFDADYERDGLALAGGRARHVRWRRGAAGEGLERAVGRLVTVLDPRLDRAVPIQRFAEPAFHSSKRLRHADEGLFVGAREDRT